ncbi:uncharacterized protein B0H64DRAFT_327077, partial [Chaetomium fimeti]
FLHSTRCTMHTPPRLLNAMDSDETSEGSVIEESRWQNGEEPVPDLDDILAQLRQEIAAWLDARADASSLDIATAYDELRHLDTREMLLLPDKNSLYLNSRYQKSAVQVIRDAKSDPILRTFDPRRQLLRSRALQLSRSRLRPLKINDLPLDILHIIFHNFQDDALTEGWECHRSVCWHEYTITQTRRRRRTISQTPDIAAGVRGIQISLGYRPKEYADDITRFTRARLRALSKFAGHCEHDVAYNYWPPENFDESSKDGELVQRAVELRRALENYRRLYDEWDEYVDATVRGETLMGPLPECQAIFQKGYAEYCRLQKEQQDLLRNCNFANALAAAASRMPNVHCFNFVDEWHPNAPERDHAEWLNDKKLIFCSMQDPLNFQDVEEESVWPEEAICKLESFDFDIANCWDGREAPLPDKDKSHLDNFLGAILSRCGQQLRILKLDLRDVSINTGKYEGSEEAYRADSILNKLRKLPRIRHLHLRCLELEGRTLNAFCRGLGSNLRQLNLSDVVVRNGVWADAFDVLRNKAAAAGMVTGPVHEIDTSFSRLHGAEFTMTDPLPLGFGGPEYQSYHYSPHENSLEQAAEWYVEGLLDSNPLRGPSLKDISTCAYGIPFPCITHI